VSPLPHIGTAACLPGALACSPVAVPFGHTLSPLSERSPYLRRIVPSGNTPVNGGLSLRPLTHCYFPYAGEIRLRRAVVGEQAVDLLLDVCQLRVAEALDRTATQQGFYE
jgi:hypothetical protein